ncbi:hypothetical protein B0H14DRAFT_1456821 [Mycena olivaceomarginata]|nr:hypothetical protein B0H14DRAFT_1456821 [Mycena olivaceomarginata]
MEGGSASPSSAGCSRKSNRAVSFFLCSCVYMIVQRLRKGELCLRTNTATPPPSCLSSRISSPSCRSKSWLNSSAPGEVVERDAASTSLSFLRNIRPTHPKPHRQIRPVAHSRTRCFRKAPLQVWPTEHVKSYSLWTPLTPDLQSCERRCGLQCDFSVVTLLHRRQELPHDAIPTMSTPFTAVASVLPSCAFSGQFSNLSLCKSAYGQFSSEHRGQSHGSL